MLKSDEVTLLIEQASVIQCEAESIQSGEKSEWKLIDPLRSELLRDTYLDWVNKCLRLMNEQTQIAFQEPYLRGGYGIRAFLKNPHVAHYQSGSGGSLARRRAGWYWNTSYELYFKNQFDNQKLILSELRAWYRSQESAPPPLPPPPAIDAVRLHPRVQAVSTGLFKNGHYRQAILQACLALNEAVKQRSGRTDLDGSPLMQLVFSPKNPILKFSGHPDEQQGYMWLFSGVSMAIRNPRAHEVGEAEDQDANEAIEMLGMISALYRALDAADRQQP